MNGRKTIIGVALGVTLLLSAVTAEAGLVTWNKNNTPFKGIGGGEFKLTVLESFQGHAVGDQFKSFCLEMNETLAGKPFADPLDPLSAWLYVRFRMQGLAVTDPGFVATTVYSAATNVDAAWTQEGSDLSDALQLAFWIIEEETFTPHADVAAFLQHMEDQGKITVGSKDRIHAQALDWIAMATAAGPTGIGRVKVLNTYLPIANSNPALPDFSPDSIRQSMMALVPLPPSATLGMVLLAGLAFFGVRRTRARKW